MKKQSYICPMHPDVRTDKPGSCPKCGMNLIEVKTQNLKGKSGEHEGHKMEGVTTDHTEHHRKMAEDFKKRFLIVLPLTIIVLILSPKIQEWFGFIDKSSGLT